MIGARIRDESMEGQVVRPGNRRQATLRNQTHATRPWFGIQSLHLTLAPRRHLEVSHSSGESPVAQGAVSVPPAHGCAHCSVAAFAATNAAALNLTYAHAHALRGPC